MEPHTIVKIFLETTIEIADNNSYTSTSTKKEIETIFKKYVEGILNYRLELKSLDELHQIIHVVSMIIINMH